MGYYGDKRLWTKVKRERRRVYKRIELKTTTCRICGKRSYFKMKAQAAPLYWIFFMTLIFGIILLVTFLSPMIESISSTVNNMSANLPLNGSVSTTVTRGNLAYNLAPLILIVGCLFAIIVVSQRREFDTGEAGYA